MSSANKDVLPSIDQLRVLIVEDDERWRKIHQQMLKRFGCQPVVAEGLGKALLEDAERKAKEYRCHLAVVDLRLMDTFDKKDVSGLELTVRLKPTISIIVSVVNSRAEVREAINTYQAAAFIGKEEGPQVLQKTILRIVEQHALAGNGAQAVWSHGLTSSKIRDQLFDAQAKVPDGEVDELISRLFVKHSHVALTLITDSEQSSGSVSAIRRQSRVFRASVDHQPSSMVVKLARVDKIQREIENYDKYVRYGIPNLFQPEMREKMLLWDMGAVAYSYLGAPALEGRNGFKTFRSFYHDTDQADAILAPLRDFFSNNNWGVWYKTGERLQGSLFEAYDTVLRGGLSKQLASWNSHEQLRAFPGLPVALINPTRWLSEHYRDAALVLSYQAVTHGDLHGNNLFIYENHAWTIDFERTGPGPILRDFVELIQDILTRIALFDDNQLPVLYELAVALCDSDHPSKPMCPTSTIMADAEARKAFLVVRDLQQLAYNCTRYEDQREYLWGLLLNSLFVARLLEKQQDPRRNRTLLVASVICARLERWDRSKWLPRNWPSITLLDGVDSLRAPIGFTQSQSSLPGVPPQPPKNGDPSAPDTRLFKEGYALLVGVGRTSAAPSLSLPVTVNDARALHQVLVDERLCAYPRGQVQLLTDETATARQICDELARLADRTRQEPNATVVVYFSGHGWRTPDGRYALIPSDVQPHDAWHSVIWAEDFIRLLGAIKARRLLVCIDACHAQGMAGLKDGWQVPGDFDKAPSPDLLSALKQGEGRVIISSSRGSQQSYYRRDGLSLFTGYLIEALRGAANRPGDTLVKVTNLVNHLGEQVPRAARAEFQAEQIPWVEQSAEDFPIALLLGGKGLDQPPLTSGSGSPSTDTSVVRTRLKQMMPAELEALCLDHFPDVALAFVPGMDHETRINQLINYVRRRPGELDRLLKLVM